MKLSLNHCFLTVHDQDVALAFYTEVLGLEVRSDVPFDGMRWLTVGSPTQPELQIGLLMPGAPWTPAEEVRAALDITAKGLMPGVIFETPDVDALFAELTGKGVEVTQEPIDQTYGIRDCGFRDPSGNHLRFSQPIKA